MGPHAAEPQEGWIPVFHGTRLSRAQTIMQSGFNTTPVADLVSPVAETYGVPVDDLYAHLTRFGKFAIVDDRPGAVYVCANPEKAGSWASRAPEAVWEALWSVWALKHPELGDYYQQSAEGLFWVLAQQLDDPPALVGMLAPATCLFNHPRGDDAATWFAKMASTDILGVPLTVEKIVEAFVEKPEWRVDPARVQIAQLLEVPTRVDLDVAAFMAGRDRFEFMRDIREGTHWGQPLGGSGFDSWFGFHQIWSLLTPERQKQLEQLAGRPIPATAN